MENYKNSRGKSKVLKYQIGPDFIIVEFKVPSRSGCTIYEYSYASAGQSNIEHMKELATQGFGLNTFIDENVRELYKDKK